MAKLPQAIPGLLLTKVGDELLVAQPFSAAVHCLNNTAGQVLELCIAGGSRKEAEQVLDSGEGGEMASELLELTLTQLRKSGLVVREEERAVAGTSRRQFLGKWGKVAVALPVISTLATRPAAAQLSCISDCDDILDFGGINPSLCGQVPCNQGGLECATNQCFATYDINTDNFTGTECGSATSPRIDSNCNMAKGNACFAGSTSYACCGTMSGADCGICPGGCAAASDGTPCCGFDGSQGTCCGGTCTPGVGCP